MGDLLKMYSFNASAERRMRVSLTWVIPLTATLEAGALSETTSAAAEVFTGAGSGTGVEAAAAVATGAVSAAGAFTMGASFLVTVTGSGLLARMLLTGMPADGFDFAEFAATVSTLVGTGAGFAVGCEAA